MSFLSEVKADHNGTGRAPYKLAEIEKTLGPKEFKEFLTALADPTISSAAIERALAKRNIKCTGNTIIKFRKDLANGNN